MDPKVIATVNESPPADSSTHDWVEALTQEISGDSAATVDYLPNAAGVRCGRAMKDLFLKMYEMVRQGRVEDAVGLLRSIGFSEPQKDNSRM